MPLFMDRHDVPGATAEDVAAAHIADLEVGKKHGVEFLSYWFDPDTGSAFCFAHAPAKDSMQAVHRESHGLVANEIITVSETELLQFLGRISHPQSTSELASAVRTILFTDLVDSTSLLESVGQAAFVTLLDEHDAIVRRALVASRGREIKHTGDGIMACFDDEADALRCAQAIQAGFALRSSDEPSSELHVRVGMAAGQPVDHNNDIYGSAVVLASRICDSAEAEQVLVSENVRDLGTARGFSFRDVGRRSFKGIAEPVARFELLSDGP